MDESYRNTTIGTASHHVSQQFNYPTKFCKFCGGRVHIEAVMCTYCGRQIEELRQSAPVQSMPVQQQMPMQQPPIIVNNYNQIPVQYKEPKNKWTAFLLCLFLGVFGAHKFYEGRIGFGIVYILTAGLYGIGWFVDLICILCKPNPYYV